MNRNLIANELLMTMPIIVGLGPISSIQTVRESVTNYLEYFSESSSVTINYLRNSKA